MTEPRTERTVEWPNGQDGDAQLVEPCQVPQLRRQRPRQPVGVQLPARAHEWIDCRRAREQRLGNEGPEEWLSRWRCPRPTRALTADKALTHRKLSPVSSPIELGSDPESRLEHSCLRAHTRKIRGPRAREQRMGRHAMRMSPLIKNTHRGGGGGWWSGVEGGNTHCLAHLRTTTHRVVSPVSAPSELGSDPDSKVEYSWLRAHERSRARARGKTVWKPGERVSADFGKTGKPGERVSANFGKTGKPGKRVSADFGKTGKPGERVSADFGKTGKPGERVSADFGKQKNNPWRLHCAWWCCRE